MAEITNGYATLDEVKAAMRDEKSRVTDDVLVRTVESASRRIDTMCNRERFGFAATTAGTAFYSADNTRMLVTDDITAITSLATDTGDDGTYSTTWAATDYQLEPLGHATGLTPRPAQQIRAIGDYRYPVAVDRSTVKIIGNFGWTAVPDAIRDACVLLTIRHFKRFDSALGVAGFGDLGVVSVRSRDADIDGLIRGYIRYDGPRLIG